MANFDWTQFTKRISVKASLKDLYYAWATQEGLERWFLRLAEFTTDEGLVRSRTSYVQKGDSYKWLWHGYGDDVAESKKIIEANGKDRIKFTFTADCLVTVTFKNESGETIVELRQENIPLDENPKTNLMIGCGEGWTFYLANLKSILEGGIDLRNKNTKIQSVINS